MHQWQKFGGNPSTDTGDIAETKLPCESRTDGRTDRRTAARTTRKHIAAAGAYWRRRLKNCYILPTLTRVWNQLSAGIWRGIINSGKIVDRIAACSKDAMWRCSDGRVWCKIRFNHQCQRHDYVQNIYNLTNKSHTKSHTATPTFNPIFPFLQCFC